MHRAYGVKLIQAVRDHGNEPMAFFDLSAKCEGGLKITTSRDARVLPAGATIKGKALLPEGERLLVMDATELHSLTETFVPSSSIDVSGPATLSCAAILEAAAESPHAMDPDFVVQINWVRVEKPAVVSYVLTNDQSRIFFQTRLLDFSGSTDVAITEKAALGLSN